MRGYGVRKLKQQQAASRQDARDARSPGQQVALLVERGHGHCEEAKRLRKENSGR